MRSKRSGVGRSQRLLWRSLHQGLVVAWVALCARTAVAEASTDDMPCLSSPEAACKVGPLQADLESFSARLASCQMPLVGPLELWGEIEDLQPMSQSGWSGTLASLMVRDTTQLTSLRGLEGVSGSLQAGLIIQNNSKLVSLHGLEGVESTGKGAAGNSIWIRSNDQLQSLGALAGVRGSLLGSLFIQNNSKLVSLHGLEGIESLGKDSYGYSIVIESNAALLSVEGLAGVRGSLPGSLWIRSNGKLVSLHGLEGIESMGKDHYDSSILIDGNAALQSVEGLAGVRGSLPGCLRIQNNGKLVSLHGLEGIESMGKDSYGYSIYVDGNAVLQSVEGLAGVRGSLPGSLRIQNNGKLVSLHGLEGIESLGKDTSGFSIVIDGNAVLQSLESLAGVRDSLPGSLGIRNNGKLVSLHGLEGIESLGKDNYFLSILIDGNDALQSVEGLAGVRGSLPGSLVIQSNGKLVSLHGLEGIESVGKDDSGFSIVIDGNTVLQSVEGLAGVRGSLPGSFRILSNGKLVSLNGLEGIESLGIDRYGHSIYVEGNAALQSVEGLAGVRDSLPGNLWIKNNGKLVSLHGLEGIESLGKDTSGYSIIIDGNDVLQSVEGLAGVRGSLLGSLVIQNNFKLVSLHGLEGIESIMGKDGYGYSIVIENNVALQSVEGLAEVRGSLPGNLRIRNSGKLVSLHGLEGIESLGKDTSGISIYVEYNDALQSVEGLAGVRGSLPGSLVIQNNGKLVSLHGLEGIESIGEGSTGHSVVIEGNAALQSVEGLAGVRGSLPGSLVIQNNGKLGSLHGLDGIECIGGDSSGKSILIEGNAALLSVEGLAGVRGSLLGCLWIKDNGKLVSLRGLDGIESMGKDSSGYSIRIEGNAALQSVEGLAGVVACRLPGILCIQNNRDLSSSAGLAGIEALLHQPSIDCTTKLQVQDLVCPSGEFTRQGSLRCEPCDQRHVSNKSSSIPFGGTEASVCHRCLWWQKPSQENDHCDTAMEPVIGAVLSFCGLSIACVLLSGSLQLSRTLPSRWQLVGRSIQIGDISAEVGRGVVLTSVGRHGLKQRRRRSFPIIFVGTGNMYLDKQLVPVLKKKDEGVPATELVKEEVEEGNNHEVPTTEPAKEKAKKEAPLANPAKEEAAEKTKGKLSFRARVLSDNRLEVLDANGDSLEGDFPASMGTVVLPAMRNLVHTGIGVPVLIPVMLSICSGLAGLVIMAMHPEDRLTETELAGSALLVSVLAVVVQRCCEPLTPLRSRLLTYQQKLQEANPNPQPCERGASRAIRLEQLLNLCSFFQDLVQKRNMYYIEPTLIKPLTARYRLSYAEVAGPTRVEWFVSHYWGHPLVDTCAALEKHARRVTDGTARAWRSVAYWICTFANNQYAVQEELGNGRWDRSSFYLALRSDTCRGACMILDENLFPLERSWCLFELLQTLIRVEDQVRDNQDSFAGMLFCTTTGTVNCGEASSEVSLNIGKRVAALRLEDAKASCLEDKAMIDALVISEMGSFEEINRKLRAQFRSALKASKAATLDKFRLIESELGDELPSTSDLSSNTSGDTSPV